MLTVDFRESDVIHFPIEGNSIRGSVYSFHIFGCLTIYLTPNITEKSETQFRLKGRDVESIYESTQITIYRYATKI